MNNIGSTAMVFGNAVVRDHAMVLDTAVVFGTAVVRDHALVLDNARVGDMAVVGGNAWVGGAAAVGENAVVIGTARVRGTARVLGTARVRGNAKVSGTAVVLAGLIDGDALILSPRDLTQVIVDGTVYSRFPQGNASIRYTATRGDDVLEAIRVYLDALAAI